MGNNIELGSGSEVHRLKTMQEGYDEKLFLKLYKLVKPVIRNLVRGIDSRRFNISSDIITSQFYDKMLYVFNKYYGKVDEEHLKANIFRALSTYKNHLLKYAYNDKAEFNQSLRSFEDLFDNDKGDIEDDLSDSLAKEEMIKLVNEYMKDKLSPDALLVWECITTPPPYVENNAKFGRITNTLLVEFFNLPRNRNSVRFIGELREDINYWVNKAREEIHYDGYQST